MKLIVGLGNPGRAHRNFRHNIGKRIVEELTREFKIKLIQDKDTRSKIGAGRIKGNKFFLAHPVIFMNQSGESVSLLLKKYKLSNKDLLIICDDLDLNLGKIRIRAQGASGGHKGLESIIEHLKTKEFSRLKIGIGRPVCRDNIKDFVLTSFNREEKENIKKTIERTADCCRVWLTQGMSKAMNKFN